MSAVQEQHVAMHHEEQKERSFPLNSSAYRKCRVSPYDLAPVSHKP